MSWLIDLFKEIPTAGVSKERIEFLQTKLTDAEKKNADSELKVDNLETKIDSLEIRIADLEQENNRLQEQIRMQGEVENLDENALQLIRIFAQDGGTYAFQEIESSVNFTRTGLKYTLEYLVDHSFLQKYRKPPGRPDTFGLTQKGRKFALENKLVGG